ncbi:hypothetical protein P171DRAFT_512910 [Karstenula rhodostoma CBS 690.94]|uniref:F-box domain-containing protein n=1 Tax=Karstenula rhodostoma CBS 690.94 TaxID=1392251 RepID=A0A9P4PMJ5_9PLEO|nr:hypothetical protein P171DRAFT_512910 [Karstenula rhodostoma CBS 690.94]
MADRGENSRKSATSPLLKLPGELRNRIYELVVASDKPVKVKYVASQGGTYAALTRVCSEIRKEFLPSKSSSPHVMLYISDSLRVQQRNARVAVAAKDFDFFVDTFCKTKANIRELVIRCSGNSNVDIETFIFVVVLAARFPDHFTVSSTAGSVSLRILFH